ncbi:unnamed protein product [Adineta ricciae]|uniref:Snake toxin/toxin-like domain-containing protein n=1 Tax=Adineta ricciae TaxID=249248 RepID=A0A813YCB4_ADIRI|nr:unnamed protein product [Adineta ricciae]
MSIKFFVTFLSFACFFTLSSSQLQCWSCDPCPIQHSNTSSSISSITCSVSQVVCVKNTIRVLGRQAHIVKGCVETCTQSSMNFFSQGPSVDCCNTDYCNSARRNQISLLLIICALSFFQ